MYGRLARGSSTPRSSQTAPGDLRHRLRHPSDVGAYLRRRCWTHDPAVRLHERSGRRPGPRAPPAGDPGADAAIVEDPRQRGVPAPDVVSGTVAGMLVARTGLSPVMVGRAAELERLRRLLTPAREPRVALISGEAGVGKT